METPQPPISIEKNWDFIVDVLGHATGFLEDIYDKVEVSKDGKSYPNLSENLDTLINLLIIVNRRAIENETIRRMTERM